MSAVKWSESFETVCITFIPYYTCIPTGKECCELYIAHSESNHLCHYDVQSSTCTYVIMYGMSMDEIIILLKQLIDNSQHDKNHSIQCSMAKLSLLRLPTNECYDA